eukprot:TRINITY_DN1313_c0_g1_i1.p1 TRINITY_DN1313_c0_g1~~TRINITY_DN1313_c0_g1_i1.p1  ORF type:complete len:129 (-),score=18.50 TRINITY_DN1313_c0_g1_i1:63-449(-)
MKRLSHTILAHSTMTKGISASLLVFDDGTEPVVKGTLLDDISAIANFKAFLTASIQIMNLKNDKPRFMTLEFESSLVIIQRLSSPTSMGTSLVCVCNNKITADKYLPCITKTQTLLNQVFRMLSYYTT